MNQSDYVQFASANWSMHDRNQGTQMLRLSTRAHWYVVKEYNIGQCCITLLYKILEIKTWFKTKRTRAHRHTQCTHNEHMHRFQCGVNGFISNEWKLRLKAHQFSLPRLSGKIREHRIADSIVELNSVRELSVNWSLLA